MFPSRYIVSCSRASTAWNCPSPQKSDTFSRHYAARSCCCSNVQHSYRSSQGACHNALEPCPCCFVKPPHSNSIAWSLLSLPVHSSVWLVQGQKLSRSAGLSAGRDHTDNATFLDVVSLYRAPVVPEYIHLQPDNILHQQVLAPWQVASLSLGSKPSAFYVCMQSSREASTFEGRGRCEDGKLLTATGLKGFGEGIVVRPSTSIRLQVVPRTFFLLWLAYGCSTSQCC
jgi:hypothetical protein